MDLDAVDRDILDVLRREGRISWQALGAAVGLSPNAAADRVRRLRRSGVVTGFTARVDPAALGRGIRALVGIRVDPRADRPQLEAWLAQADAVEEAVHLTGRWDYELAVAVPSIAALDDLLAELKDRRRVVESETRIVLRTVAAPDR